MELSQEAPVEHVVDPERKPRIGYLWEHALKSWERHIFRQVTGSRDFRPVVLCRKIAGDPADLGLPIVRLTRSRRPLWKLYQKHVARAPRKVYNQWVRALVDASRQEKIRLMHVFFGTKGIAYLPALRRMDMAVTISFHGRDVGECVTDPALAAQLPDLFQVADCIMVRSEHMSGRLLSAGCPRSKLWVNRTGIPTEQFPWVRRTRSARDPIVFLQACRLVAKKGIDLSLQAFAHARRELPEARLCIAGDGPLRRDLDTMVAELGLDGSVTFLGNLSPSELLRALHEAHVFLHPSRTTGREDQEGIPNSILEAMSTGLMPIATRHAGIPEVVDEGRTGWLVEELATEHIAERMVRCARDPGRTVEMGAEGRRFVAHNFSLDQRMRLLDKKFGELIATRQQLKCAG